MNAAIFLLAAVEGCDAFASWTGRLHRNGAVGHKTELLRSSAAVWTHGHRAAAPFVAAVAVATALAGVFAARRYDAVCLLSVAAWLATGAVAHRAARRVVHDRGSE